MTIQRAPHPTFAVLWAIWFGNVLAAVALPDRPLYGLVVLLAFLPIEGIATATATSGNRRDTLSEIFTWLQRTLARDRNLLRGWNAMLLLVVTFIVFLFARTVLYYSGNFALAATTFALTMLWLVAHFWHPDRVG